MVPLATSRTQKAHAGVYATLPPPKASADTRSSSGGSIDTLFLSHSRPCDAVWAHWYPQIIEEKSSVRFPGSVARS